MKRDQVEWGGNRMHKYTTDKVRFIKTENNW